MITACTVLPASDSLKDPEQQLKTRQVSDSTHLSKENNAAVLKVLIIKPY